MIGIVRSRPFAARNAASPNARTRAPVSAAEPMQIAWPNNTKALAFVVTVSKETLKPVAFANPLPARLRNLTVLLTCTVTDASVNRLVSPVPSVAAQSLVFVVNALIRVFWKALAV